MVGELINRRDASVIDELPGDDDDDEEEEEEDDDDDDDDNDNNNNNKYYNSNCNNINSNDSNNNLMIITELVYLPLQQHIVVIGYKRFLFLLAVFAWIMRL